MEFCEFCGSILNEDGSCPWEDCPTNAILEVLNVEEDEEIPADDDDILVAVKKPQPKIVNKKK